MKLAPFLLFVALSGVACADPIDDLFDRLRIAVKAEIKTARAKKDAPTVQRLDQLLDNLLQLRNGGATSEEVERLAHTAESLGTFSASDKVEEICDALAKELRTQQDKREQEAIAQFEATLASARRTTLDSKAAKDLDAPLAAVSGLARDSESRNLRSPRLRTLVTEAQHLSTFIKQWQDYLANTASGNGDAARQNLQNLTGNTSDYSGFVPRSELLAKIADMQKAALPVKDVDLDQQVRAIVLNAKMLDDMPKAIADLAVVGTLGRTTGFSSNTLGSALERLRSFNRTYEDLKKGLAASISLSSLNSSSSFDGSEALTSLRNQLILFALPRAVGLPPDAAAKPDENVATFLQRALDTAREKQDWALALRILEAAQTLGQTAVASAADRTALLAFLAGSNQERARQYALAVTSYQAALKTGSQLVRAEFIGDHLEAIRKDHPQEFEQGIQLTLSPPASVDNRRPPGYPLNLPWPPGSAPTTAAPPPGPEKPAVLSVPAVPPKPEAAGDAAKPRPQ